LNVKEDRTTELKHFLYDKLTASIVEKHIHVQAKREIQRYARARQVSGDEISLRLVLN